MADSGHRGRSSPRGPYGPREGVSEYRSASDPYRRPSRPLRSPDRERGSTSQRQNDKYCYPGENNYRPIYSPPPSMRSPPLMRSDSTQDSNVPSARTTSTNNEARSDRLHVADVKANKGDEASHLTVSSSRITKVATTMEQPGEEAAKALASLLQQIVTDAVDCSTLKLRQNNAQMEFDRRSTDFNSTLTMHEKYPAVAETQARSKTKAELDLKAISEKVEVRESTLSDLATQCVAQVIPQIVAATTDRRQDESRYKESQLRIENLEAKFEDHRKRLENSQKQAKAQEMHIEHLKKSLDKQRRLFEEKFEYFSRRFEESQRLIDNQGERYRTLEDKCSKLSDECSDTKGVLIKDVQSQLASAKARVFETGASIKTLSNDVEDITALAARLESDLSSNMRPRLEELSGLTSHVSTIPTLRLDIDSIKQEAKKLRNELVKHMKNIVSLEEYHDKVNSLDGLRDTISELQRDITKFDNRLHVAETRKPSPPPTPPMDSSSKNPQLDRKTIAALEESISQVIARCNALEQWQERQDRPIDYETLKREILDMADDKQEAADKITGKLFTELRAAVEVNQSRVRDIEGSIADVKTSYDPSIALPGQLRELTTQQVATVQNVVNLIQTQPELLPLDFIDRHILKRVETRLEPVAKDLFEASLQSVHEKMESYSEGLAAVDQRVNNINTKTMALFIIEQIESLYPDVRNAQDSINAISAKFSGVDALLNTFGAKVNALETRDLKTSPDENIMLIRSEVDGLARSISKIQGTATVAKRLSDIANDSVTAAKDNNKKFQGGIADVMGKFHIDLEEIKVLVQNITAKLEETELNKSSAGVSSRSVPASATSAQEPPLALRGQGHKKRKLNGSHISPISSTGGQKSPKVSNGSSRRRRHRFTTDAFNDDNSEDSNFEPNLPSISDDDDEI